MLLNKGENLKMERLPVDISLKIFCLLDHQNLAAVQQVSCKWRELASNTILWENLFKGRWGEDTATFYAPVGSKSWKDMYEVQDRCDRVGLGLKIIREGGDYYLVHQGEVQRHLGSRRQRKETNPRPMIPQKELKVVESMENDEPRIGILDKILFFIGDLESASSEAKRSRVV